MDESKNTQSEELNTTPAQGETQPTQSPKETPQETVNQSEGDTIANTAEAAPHHGELDSTFNCPACFGDGLLANGTLCPDCDGTGKKPEIPPFQPLTGHVYPAGTHVVTANGTFIADGKGNMVKQQEGK